MYLVFVFNMKYLITLFKLHLSLCFTFNFVMLNSVIQLMFPGDNLRASYDETACFKYEYLKILLIYFILL